jgi:hypothetical protein
MRTNLPATLRVIALSALVGLAVPFYLAVLAAGDQFGNHGLGNFVPLFGLTATYVAAVALIWWSRPATSARWRWIELGVIAAGGLALRAIFWPHPPTLSHDAYRYVWDAHLVLHGVSPYMHSPLDPSLVGLRDSAIWPNVNWPTSPTIYPPAAEIFYLLISLIVPLNIWALKVGIALCDIGSGLLTLVLLRRFGLDLRRVALYWWSPIPILEFAYSAHVDALAVLLTLATLVVAAQHWRGARMAAGVLLGLAALTKLYPLLFVVVLVRRRDWGFLGALAGTIVIGYLPFIRLGLGGGGFLGTYFHQRFYDQGFMLRPLSYLMFNIFHATSNDYILAQLACIALLAGVIMWWRWRFGLRPEAGLLALSAVWISFSPHVFPWYVAAPLPLLTLYLGQANREKRASAASEAPSPFASMGRGLAGSRLVRSQSSARVGPAGAFWLFVLCVPFEYAIFSPTYILDGVYALFFLVPAALLAWDIWRRRAYRACFAEVRATWGDVTRWLRPSYSLPAEE